MVKWAQHIYMGERIKKRSTRYMHRIETGHRMAGLYVIILSPHPDNQLEILQAVELYQPLERNRLSVIVGLAYDYAETLEILYRIIEDAESIGMQGKLKAFLMQQEGMQ